MTTPPDQADTPMRWYVLTAGHHDAHYGALAMNGTVVAHCGMSFTPQPDLFELGPLWLRSPADPARCCPHLPDHQHPQHTETPTETDGATVAGLIETL